MSELSSTEPAVELELDNEQAAHGSLAKVHPFVGNPATPSSHQENPVAVLGPALARHGRIEDALRLRADARFRTTLVKSRIDSQPCSRTSTQPVPAASSPPASSSR